MGESAAAAKRRTRRIPDELRKRSAQSCDLCRKRRCKCVTEPNGVDCVACKGQGLSCSYTLPRKTRFYGSLEDLSDRYKCLDAIVRGAFPDQPVATASDLIQLAQRLQIDIPDLSLDDPDTLDVLLRGKSKVSDDLSFSETQQDHRKSVDLGFDPVRETDGHHDDTSGKREDSAFQDQGIGLLRDTSGHEHYIGPSGSLQFLDQLRRLLISRETEISTDNASQFTSDGTQNNAPEALDIEVHFNEGLEVATVGQRVSQVEDSLSPQAISSSSIGMTPNDDIQELMDQIPKREIIEGLLPLYWTNVHGDFPLFHRESFEEEYQSFLGNHFQSVNYSPASGVPRPDHGWIGCLHMMVVFGSLSDAAHHNDLESKALQKHCVDATRKLLPRIVTKCSLSGVQALLLLSLFLHNDNERNAAWNLVGTATRICFALGLHRNDLSELFSPVERELRRRVFCTLYGFEQFLASSLGRPSGVNDIDVQVVHPRGGVLNGRQDSDDALNIMSLKLTRILSTSRNPRYASASTAQAPHEAHQLSVEEVLGSLKAWKAELSSQRGLEVPVITEKDDKLPVPNGPCMELGELKTLLGWRDPSSVRAILLLYIQYHYIYILVTRPFLLRSITASGRTGQAPQYGPDSRELNERSLLVALRDLVVRLRELVLKVPKSSTMERFARAMVTFEESAYHVKVKADQEGSERDPPSSMAQRHFGAYFSGPNLLFRGLMDASYGPKPPDGVVGMDQQMQDNTAGMVHDQHQHFLENGWVLPTPATGTFGGQGSGLTSFDCLPGLNPWAMGGNQNAQHGTEMPIYGWEDLESMLGNGRSHPRKS
ncbi:putative transcription factor cys6 [Diaporthe ampelina]|uniref:Putative transcription factor cys6 n=1 Tax=Diaporthe ampelina TaxID=1214573 RepID=A0A0G2FDA5_9PEZI|nr:putative transcription factor cys6 [Diaporthe ampelina]